MLGKVHSYAVLQGIDLKNSSLTSFFGHEVALFNLERSVGRENRVQVIGLIGVMKKFAFTWLVNQIFII